MDEGSIFELVPVATQIKSKVPTPNVSNREDKTESREREKMQEARNRHTLGGKEPMSASAPAGFMEAVGRLRPMITNLVLKAFYPLGLLLIR